MAGHAANFRQAAKEKCPAIHDLNGSDEEDVDTRARPGHDGEALFPIT
jgi:hypothetical protein